MDYVSRQFINLTKKFRKELRPLLTHLADALEEQAKATSENTKSTIRAPNPAPEVTVVNQLPNSIEIHQNPQDTRDERNYKRALFFLTALSLGGFVVYANLVFLQYKEMIAATTASQKAADAAKVAADVARQSQRPVMWLSNDNGTPSIFQSPNNANVGQIVWTWHFTNYGKIPPENVRFRQYIKLGSAAPMLSYGEIGDDIGPPTPPGKDEMDTVISNPIPINAARELIEQGQVSIMIHMTYTDASKSQYETGICLRRTALGSVPYCTQGNYVR